MELKSIKYLTHTIKYEAHVLFLARSKEKVSAKENENCNWKGTEFNPKPKYYFFISPSFTD